ncbi:hypothetical protein KCU92_g2277, partial [Aureobasidium melanogenum]|jgi:hypothetical protein
MNPMPVSLHDLFAFGTPTSCIGHTKGSRRCGNHSSQQNLELARKIWDAIAAGANDDYVNEEMKNLAAYCLCKSQHQNLTTKIADIWLTQYPTWKRHQAIAAGLHTVPLPNAATETTPADQIKTEMYAQFYCHQQRYENITHEQVVSLRKESQPDVEMSDAF